MARQTVLISGAGIAGPALAYWLARHGFAPTLVERASGLRGGGHVVHFGGAGYDVAGRMGLHSEINRIGYLMRELRMVDRRGRRVAGFGRNVFSELTDGRFVAIARSDLSRLLFGAIAGSVEVVFGDEITGLKDAAEGVLVTFKRARERRFDLVIGADGLHSTARERVFGPRDRFERPLGHMVAAFQIPGYRPRDEEVYVTYGLPGRVIVRFAMHGDRTLFLLFFAEGANPPAGPIDASAGKAVVREQLRDGGWECRDILANLERALDFRVDRICQIRMDRWSRGRVALIGDAAFCVSPLSGQGASLAVTSAYVLAGELARSAGNHVEAFHRYERLLRPFLAAKQRGAERLARMYAPKTRWGGYARNQILNALGIPGIAKLSFGRGLIDRLALPDYF